jgi:hypothetical protein
MHKGVQMDQREFEAWLETRSREDAILIALRIALRIAPQFLKILHLDTVREHGASSLYGFRSVLCLGVRPHFMDEAVKLACSGGAGDAIFSRPLN